MAKYIKLPDNSLFPVTEGEDYSAAMRAAYAKYPEAFGAAPAAPQQDTTGFKAAASASASRLGGEFELLKGKLGIQTPEEAEAKFKQAEETAAKRFTPTEQGWTEAPFQKFKETLGGSVPYMAAPAAAGLAALAAPVAAPIAAGLGLAGAGAVSAGQFTGSNLAAQLGTGKTLEEASLGKAVGAAIPQALIDTAAMALLPGVGKLFGSVGSKLTAEQAKAIASQTLARTAADYTAKTGAAMGREGVTEVAQQALERLQAGLEIADPEARKEYIDSFIGGAVLGGAIAPVGRAFERSGAKAVVAQEEAATAAKTAAEAEAAKNQPDALRQLDADYRAATQQKITLDQQVAATKPKKGSTPEERAAHQQLKDERAKMIETQLRPLSQEYNKRKGAISALEDTRQAELEAQTAEQPTAAAPVPTEEPKRDVQKLMLEQDTLRKQMEALEAQLGQADPEQFDTLNAQRQELQRRLDARATLIEEAGGSPLAQTEFEQATAAKMQGIDSRMDKLTATYTAALEAKDYDAAAKAKDELLALRQERTAFTDKTAQQMQAMQEKQKGLEQRGQTRDLFSEAPAPTGVDQVQRDQVLADEKERALYGPDSRIEAATQTFAAATEGPRGQLEQAAPQQEATAESVIQPKQLGTLASAQQNIATAQAELDDAVKNKKMASPAELYPLLDKLNQAQNESSRASEDVGRPTLKPAILDIFSPANLFNTAYANGDTNLINALARQTDRTTLKTVLDEKASEREKLTTLLDTRLDLAGQKRERADLFSKQYEPKQQALFKNGTYPDKDMQDLYDKGGPAAVEYENVIRQVEELSNKVTAKQGNAKKSLYEQLVDLAAEHAELTSQMETGTAAPTKGEKVAGLQAKLGKGEAPAARQMDAAEKYQLQRRITAVENKYKMVEGKVAPIRDLVAKTYASLYTTTPLEKASVIEARKEAAADAEARAPKAVTRTAKTAARIAKGDVRKEAETSQKMRDLALELGEREPEIQKLAADLAARGEALSAKYGDDDKAVQAFRVQAGEEYNAKAREIGKKTPEYKATLKEQIAYFQEVLPTAGKQVAATKRSTQVTRKQTAAPSRLVTSSPESRKETEAEGLREKRRMFRDFQSAIDDEKNQTAYRLREGDTSKTVDSADAQKVIDGLKLPENVKFVYAATTGKIPVRLLNMMAAEGVDPNEGMVQGAVFSDGTVLVVGDQHADVTDLEKTIAHEIIGHYGVDTVIGLDKLNAYAKKTDVIALAEEIGGKGLVAEVMQTVRSNAAMGRSEEVQKLQALREIIAHTEEARITESFKEKAGRFMKELVGMVRAGLRAMGLQNAGALSTSDVFYMLKQSRKAFENKTVGVYRDKAGEIAFRIRRTPGEFDATPEPSAVDKFLGNALGLAGRMQLVDKFAAVSEAFKIGMNKGVLTDTEAGNAEYLLRFGEHRSQLAGQALTNGPLSLVTTKTDKGIEHTYKSTKGPNALEMAEALGKGGFANDSEAEGMFTLYLAGLRAAQVGWDKLNYTSPDAERAKHQRLLAALDAAPKKKDAIEAAAKIYKQYNAGLMDFLVQTGEITAAKAAELKAITYVPFYRVNAQGEVQLMIDKERPLRIGNIKDEPQLQQLVGDNKQIMPVFTSMVQNTFMLTNLGLRNQSVKETAFMLRKLGVASRIANGPGPRGSDTVRFKKNGMDMHVVIDTDMYGIPAKYIVEGMEGIKTTIPAVVKLLGIPADLLRKFVTRAPTYAVRQMIRDPLNAWLTTGTDATPVLSSFKELAQMVAGRSETERTLMESGAVSSNVFTGDERDMDKVLREITTGKAGWTKLLAKADAFALQGDTATRAVIYKDSLAKGMSHQQALLRSVESMNFSRRGLSPSIQMLSTMIPFFNAQIQGLDVLYRAFTGKMPYNEQLKIREKLVKRGLLLAAGTMAYAVAMQDDEAYQRAKPEERYGNWFVYVPGFDEPLRVPIPFELGYLFKSLPEAIVNMAYGDEKAGKALGGVGTLLAQSNPFALPQAVKPLTEVVLGKSFFSGDIESTREKDILPTDRYRDSTTEISKLIGSVTGKVGVSPISLDYLIRGYTGGLGIALVQLANPLLNTEAVDVPKPSMKPSKIPFIGGLFQPVEGRGTLDSAYEAMTDIRQTKRTYDDLISKGKRAEAQAFAQEYANKLSLASTSGSVQQALGKMAAQERIIKNSTTMTTEQKDVALERLDKMKVAYARQFLTLADRTTPR
jgi:hypothetical protein